MDTHIEFKRKIDNARNILVGAVPSPAGQIDQITYALIYKFMSDIDDKSARLPGGKRQYFVGEHEKYDWHNLMRLDGQDKLNRYRDALSKMNENPHLPEIFRSIYQNAFLPYNDPRTLNLFLKEIDGFVHTKSDAIGDAYEYLLSITGAQGDVGQFRTPRHIIKFIVDVVQPGKDDTVLDPACGTAGFLIAAYNYVRTQHDGVDEEGNPNGEQRLTADERARLHNNYFGYDIDPTMVRTATVNMYLHGFSTPNIEIHDTLTSEEHWQKRYDVVLANPPFMTPKGGIQPHGKFGVKANRAEVLFVDYIASHLKPTGRAGIIVPEGIIFQSGNAYKELRKSLVENSLYAVVSLPSGVFQPYTGVKTSILLIDKTLAKERDEVLFIDVQNTGISLGSTGRKIEENDLPDAMNKIYEFKNKDEIEDSELCFTVSKDEIRNNQNYDLKQSLYRKRLVHAGHYSHVKLGEVASVTKGKSSSTKTPPGDYPLVLMAENFKTSDHFDFEGRGVCVPLMTAASTGVAVMKRVHYIEGKFALANLLAFVQPNDENILESKYLYRVLLSEVDNLARLMKGAANVSMKTYDLEGYEIPLPPIEVQREIVAELNSYQKIIDSAQTIVKTYKPTIKINPDWGTVKVSDIFNKVTESWVPAAKNASNFQFYVGLENIETNTGRMLLDSNPYKSLPTSNKTWFKRDDILYGRLRPNLNKVARSSLGPSICSTDILVLRPKDPESTDSRLYSVIMRGEEFNSRVLAGIAGAQLPRVKTDYFFNLELPKIPVEIQRRMVAELEAEQKIIDANKKLIEIYQKKIKDKIAEVWGE
jgi:type I restriction enzyme M protein